MDLSRLFAPRGVAFVGASDDTARYGGRALRYAREAGYAGGLYPVHPRHDRVQGLACYPDVTAIPGPVDVAVALVGPARIPALMEGCRAKGIGFLVAVGEIAEGTGEAKAEATRRLGAMARDGGPAIVGPVMVGVVAPHARLAMSISSGLVDGMPAAGDVAVISQSGGMLGSVIDRSRRSGVGFSALVSSGLEAHLGACDYIEHFVADSLTACIAVYSEGIDDMPRLYALAHRARDRGKVLAVLLAGRSEAGGRAALSHTGRMAGDRAVLEAAFRRHGIVPLADLDDLHITAAALARHKGIRGGVGVMSLSGGYAVVAGDALSDAGVPLAAFGPETVRGLREAGIQQHPTNPLDAGNRPTADRDEDDIVESLALMDADPAVGATLYAETVFLNPERCVAPMAAFARKAAKPLLVCWQAGDSIAGVVPGLRGQGITVVDTLDDAVRVLRALTDAGRPIRALEAQPAPGRMAGSGALAARDAASLLAAYGVPLVQEAAAVYAADAERAAARVGFPVVLKGDVPGVHHKTERKLVRVGLADGPAVLEAARAMQAANPDLAGFIVQPLVQGLEFIVGVRNDPRAGPAVLLAFGGVLAEAVERRAVALAPLAPEDADAMIDAVDRSRLLDGWRGGPPLARTALRDLLLAVGRFAWAEQAALAELDLNPVIVGPHTAVAVDALAVAR